MRQKLKKLKDRLTPKINDLEINALNAAVFSGVGSVIGASIHNKYLLLGGATVFASSALILAFYDPRENKDDNSYISNENQIQHKRNHLKLIK